MGQVAAVASSKGARHAALSLGLAAPTPERAAKGAQLKDGSLGQSSFRVETQSRAVEVGDDDSIRVERVSEKRVRMTDNVFERLKARGELARDDDGLNRILYAAGYHYGRLHYNAGMDALRGFDLSKGFTTARGEMSDAAAERRADWQKAFREADDVLSGAASFQCLPRAIVLRKVVLEDMKLFDVGRSICEAKDKAVVAAIALHELKSGLRALAHHFGYLTAAASG